MSAKLCECVILGTAGIQTVEQQQERVLELERRLLERASDVRFLETHVGHSLRRIDLINRSRR